MFLTLARNPGPRRRRTGLSHLMHGLLLCGASLASAQEPLFTIVQISDSQPDSATEDQRFVEVLQVIAAAGQPGSLLPRPIDLVLFAGDITWGNSNSEWVAATQKLQTYLTANDIPFRAVPGNHDTNNGDTSLYELHIADSGVWDIGSAAFTGHNGPARTTGWNGLRFIGFNNSNPGWNTISSSDLSDIQARVDEFAAAGENVFLLCHHPHDEKARLPLVNVLPNPSVIGYCRGHNASPHVTKGLAGIVNPNIWDFDTNSIVDDRGLIYTEVFQDQLRAHVLVLDNDPTALPSPVVVPLLHPLTPASEPDHGVAGSVHANARANPSGEAPERKLWYQAGSWWGVLWSDASSAHRIQRLNEATQAWVDTGPTVSTSVGRSFDVLAEGDTLYVASNLATVPSESGNGSPGQLLRFTYLQGGGVYALDSGFPVDINDSRSETLSLAKDSTGRLWVTWTRDGAVYLNHTQGSETAWAAPFWLASGLAPEETSALVAFDGHLGLLWPTAAAGTVSFALHADLDPAETWVTESVTSQADLVGDQIDVVADLGRVLAAVRGSGGALTLFERSVSAPGSGTWTAREIADAASSLQDPVLIVDDFFSLLRVFATAPTLAGQSLQGGGAIYEKISALSPISFPHGRGTPVIQDGLHPSAGFATTTRQLADEDDGLLVLASIAQTERYWHSFDALAVAPVAPVADFVGSPLSGPAPVAVQFSDLSSGAPTDWLWDFGDGTTSTDQDPQHVYTQVGTFRVSLRAASGAGETTLVRTAYVDVAEPPPILVFTPVADTRANEASPDGNFGTDAALRVKAQAGSSFQSFLKFDLSTLPGSAQSATLRFSCTDSSNAGGSVYLLTDNTWTETGLTWSNKPILPAQPVATMGGVTATFWAEVDVSSAVLAQGLNSFALAGGSTNSAIYGSRESATPPQLVVTFAQGGGTPPSADFTGTPLAGSAPLSVAFTDLSTGNPTGWSWDFGDGASSTQRHPVHLYTQPGSYTVVLDVTNPSGLGSLQRLDYVTVSPPPPIQTLTPVADARVSEGSPTSNSGSSTTLRVKSSSGSAYQSFLRFDVSALADSVLSAKLGLACTEASNSGGRLYSLADTGWTEPGITWANKPDLPGSSLSALGAVTLGSWVEFDVASVVTGPGTYVFALAGGSADSCQYSSREGANAPQLVVETGILLPPTADFSAAPTAGSAPLSVAFTDLSTAATGWSWDFGDGATSTERHPVHVYTTPGTYAVSLDVGNSVGNDALVLSDLVSVGPPAPVQTLLPVADARVSEGSPNSSYGAELTTRIRLSAGASYHTYLTFDLAGLAGSPLTAKLRLFVTDGSSSGGVVFATTSSWTESGLNWSNKPAPVGSPVASAGTVVTGTWVEFDVTPALVLSGLVSFAIQSTSSNTCSYSSREGTQPPQLVVTTGAPVPPTADFSATPTSGNAPLAVAFTNLSSAATSFLWTFGDGVTSTAQHPVHVYAAQGTYSVTLEVANALGNASLTRTDLISAGAPLPMQTFLPVADARVNEASVNANYGTDASMRVRFAAGGSYETYVRFDVAALSGPVTSARLRLFVTDGSDVGGVVFPTSSSWTESGVNWTNRPAASGGQLASASAVAAGAWVEFDVTPAVAPGPVSFVLRTTSSNSCYYSTREGANPPELIVTTGP